MRCLLMALIAVLCGLSSCWAEADYMPLAVGQEKTISIGGERVPTFETIHDKIVGTITWKGNTYYVTRRKSTLYSTRKTTQSFTCTVYLRKSKNTFIEGKGTPDFLWEYVQYVIPRVGDTWLRTYGISQYPHWVMFPPATLSDSQETFANLGLEVVTAAGRHYANCCHLRVTTGKVSVTDIWLAPHVGMVKMILDYSKSQGGKYIYALNTFKAGK